MDIAEWRKKIDEIDRQLVELVNRRAAAAKEIGRLKRNSDLPIYEPEREKKIFENVTAANQGPLPNGELIRVFERLIDVMRKLQKDEIVGTQGQAGGTSVANERGDTELEAEIND